MGEIAAERPRKGQIAPAVVDNVPQVPVAAESDMAYGMVVDASIVDPRTASGTTTGCPGRTGRLSERTVEGMPAGSQGLGKTGWMGTQNGQVAGRSTIWCDSLWYPGNEVGQMQQEGEEMADDQRRVVYVHVAKMRDEERTSSRRNGLAAVNAYIQGDPLRPAYPWVTADYMRRREW